VSVTIPTIPNCNLINSLGIPRVHLEAMRSSISAVAVLATVVAALPLIEHNGLRYASEAARSADLPIVKLGYALQQATSYDRANDV
jgi:hypothetical protein